MNVDKEITEIFNRVLGGFQQPKYRYFTLKDSQDRYFYTCEKINHNGKPRYVAGIYRYIKTKKQWKMVKSVGFAKKYRAIEWARKAKLEIK